MKEIISKVLQCTVAFAFCFSTEGMRSVTIDCEQGTHPTKLSITFDSADSVVNAIRRGISLTYRYRSIFGDVTKQIVFYKCEADNGYFLCEEDRIVGFCHINTTKPVTLLYSLYNATESGTYIVRCGSHLRCMLLTEEQ